jgi:glycosyltransferase involved in cell wall biosynthesis
LKPTIALSAVNVTNTGLLAVLHDALVSLSDGYSKTYEIVALVHSKSLFDIPGITFIEFPEIKRSWLRRLWFEYYECLSISEAIRPRLWFAMHDMTPNVKAETRAVYCHNPCPFYPFRLKDALLDWKFGLFTLLYRFLYGINIRANNFVVVQQSWMRDEFRSQYGVRNIVVAHPSVEDFAVSQETSSRAGPYTFFYPSYPRTFKNIEQILKSVRRLESSGFCQFEVWLTMDGSETRYAAKLVQEFSGLATVKWLGLLPRAEVMRRYGETDCLLFPSRLETWGMPITEFKTTGKPILAANLPYAHETVGEYGQVAFFDTDDDQALAKLMRRAVIGENVFRSSEETKIDEPFSRNWEELWAIVLES